MLFMSFVCLSVIVTAKRTSLKLRIQLHFLKSSHGLSTMDLSQIPNNFYVAICFIEIGLYIVLFYALCGPCKVIFFLFFFRTKCNQIDHGCLPL